MAQNASSGRMMGGYGADQRAEAEARETLERELRQFVSDVCLSDEERRHQAALVAKVQRLARACLHSTAQVLVFGSSASGLCEKSSDVDATIKVDFEYLSEKFHGTLGVSPAPSETRALCAQAIATLAEYVRTTEAAAAASGAAEDPQQEISLRLEIKNEITTAKVPILILSSSLGHSIDVSINNELPLYNTILLRTYAQVDERVRILVLCVKRWARLAGVTDAKNCNLSSYSWVLLCIYYLQVRHSVEPAPPGASAPAALLMSLQELARQQPPHWFKDRSSGREFDVRCVASEEICSRMVEFSSRLAQNCKATASELLKGFFTFYASAFQWGVEVVSIRAGVRLAITHQQSQRFQSLARGKLMNKPIHIEDPFDLQRNLNCVLDEAGLLRIKNAFVDVARRVAEGSNRYTLLLQQARLLFYGRQVVPSRGFYVDAVADSDERRVDLW